MKAVIVDLNENDAVALRDDGRFEKIKNKNYTIGQELTMQPQVIRFPKQPSADNALCGDTAVRLFT